MAEAPDEAVLTPEAARVLEVAALAVGRLEALVSVSPVRRAWLRRSTFLAAIRAIEADGYSFEVERLFALSENLPVAHLKDYGLVSVLLKNFLFQLIISLVFLDYILAQQSPLS